MAEAIQPVPPDELQEALAGPAVFANRFFITVGPIGVRIAFTEQVVVGKPLHYRTGVVLSIEDGISLAKLLSELLKGPAEAIEKAKAASAAAAATPAKDG